MKKSVIMFLVAIMLFILLYTVLEQHNGKERKGEAPEEVHAELVAFHDFLSQDVISWPNDELVALHDTSFALIDLKKPDDICILIVNNDKPQNSYSIKQVIYQYNRDVNKVEPIFNTIDAYDEIYVYDDFGNWIITQRAVKGVFSTFYYDSKGQLIAEKTIAENPSTFWGNNKEELSIKLFFDVGGKPVDAIEFEQTLYNFDINMMMHDGKRVDFVTNDQCARQQLLKYKKKYKNSD